MNQISARQQLSKFKSIEYWLEGLGKSTQANYAKYFLTWLEYTKEKLNIDNPDMLIELRKEDMKSDDRQKRKRFEHIAKTWYHSLYEQFEKEGKSTGHAYNFLKSVMSFFSRNDLPLRFRRRELKRVKKKIKRIHIEIEDLKTAYELLDIRERAIFTTLLQSGLSEIDVCALNIEDIETQLDNPPVYIEGFREKTDVVYQTCIGEDASIAIQKYLKLRDNPKKGILFETKFGDRITPRSIREALQPIEKVIPHFKVKVLRDVFHDALERANIKEALATRMFGHELGVKGKYHFSPHTIKSAYMRAYPFLTIDTYTRATSHDKSIQDLILKLGEVMATIATRGQSAGIDAILGLIEELKGTEMSEQRKAILKHTYSKDKKTAETELQNMLREAMSKYLSAI